ncbi:TPA: hypothetical protein PQC92_002263 [Staphylococcus aureus]|uniref:Phage protein n=3 Tax=Staphylococcus TaxID=1279 RepID=A0A380FXJ7_9STAP|nr:MULTISPECIES: hypothetical protein [Staphylococcus]EHS76979.1 hypothetical protein IS189_2684 [Staphylococcus aureus subsp. aureus IS-189]AGY90158.1 Hypothetical protein SAZ172_2058 [Staphylococcus aureus subsp. aureus Z172]AID40592.1 hypothetical protein SAXN108_2151 [Staphylococcus aureus]AND36728.1 hypothetical protein ASL17_11530 [Staphylococcus aureus]AND45392.1 hypothetical protein ASL18_11520 [Staphylococcus aureus]
MGHKKTINDMFDKQFGIVFDMQDDIIKDNLRKRNRHQDLQAATQTLYFLYSMKLLDQSNSYEVITPTSTTTKTVDRDYTDGNVGLLERDEEPGVNQQVSDYLDGLAEKRDIDQLLDKMNENRRKFIEDIKRIRLMSEAEFEDYLRNEI